jgi:hypothetical protein
MRKALTLILGVALFGILAAVVVASQGADDPAGTTGTVTETVERTTTVEDNPNRVRDDNDAQGEDISGPCDEAEHANDPRCTGRPGNPSAGDDNPGQDDNPTRVDNSGPGSMNSGPGSVHSGRDDRADDDRRGEVEPGDDHGGHGEVEPGDDHGGRGEVEVGDDHGGNSGPGGGDSSGHGGGDD